MQNLMDLKKIKNSAVPPMVMIGIVPEHYSYELIKESGEFVINVPTKGFEKEYYYLGTKSGRDEDKFSALNLEWEEGMKVNAPLLSACPISVECKVTQKMQVFLLKYHKQTAEVLFPLLF